jgi:hypothetical protein
MKKHLLILLLAIMCFSVKTQAQIDTTNSEWKYSNRTDEMTGDKSYLAQITSIPSTNYGIISKMCIRFSKNGNEVIFGIDGALINSGVNGLPISVKFDDGKIEKFQGTGSSTNEFKIIFIEPSSKFIKELKTSKKLLIQVEIYNKGNEVFHFNTDGFIWNYK